MKRIFSTLVLAIITYAACLAQDTQCYALTKQGACLRYSYTYGKKLMAYYDITVQENKTENGKTVVSTLWKLLNKKGKPSKSAAIGGFGDGLLTSITIENNSYYMTNDLGLAGGGENRHGYILKIPATLNVGDTIEGSTLNSETKFMGATMKNELTYNNFKVVEETDLTTAAGTFHCFKVTGNVKGKFSKMDIDDNQVMYIAPGMGIIRQEINYLGDKRPIVIEVCSVSGL